MKIRIREDARKYYIASSMGTFINWDWANTMEQVQGMVLEVETEYLFKNQYNTVPVPGVSDNGLRIMDNMVSEVIDDEREGKARCNWCGKTVPDAPMCFKCGRQGYMESFSNRYRRA